MKPTQLLPDLFCFADTCNVYVVRDGDEAIAIDFGSGEWLDALPDLGVRSLRHVLLTHHHADQCAGLAARRPRAVQVHAPAGEEPLLSPKGVAAYWRQRRAGGGVPPSYCVLPRGLRHVRYDMAGFSDLFWGTRRLRFIHTPGHGPHALSVVLTHHGKQIIFCGDAAHANATVWQPYHLEWDHWTGGGALAAWEGVQRLANLRIDLLCPSHGPAIQQAPRRMLRQLARKLMAFYHAKGQIAPGERDDYLPPDMLRCGARRLLPNLYEFATNGYLLRSASNEALLIDPPADAALTAGLLDELGHPAVTAATATHYHSDHTEGLPHVRRAYGATIWLHPWVDAPLRDKGAAEATSSLPFLPPEPVRPDHLWPERGRWRWNEYAFQVAPFPGQTWWHCAFMAVVDGCKVMFGGDNFQPPSRWNGTGGFCAFNGSRFEGFARSARLVLRWSPDVIATGHRTCYRYHAAHFRKIVRWTERAEAATRALCPTGDLDADYHLHRPQG